MNLRWLRTIINVGKEMLSTTKKEKSGKCDECIECGRNVMK